MINYHISFFIQLSIFWKFYQKLFISNLRHSIMLTFISKTSSFFVIHSNHIVQAHQTYDYSVKHENISKVTATVRELIKYIVLTYSNNIHKTFFKSIDRFKFVKFSFYFENWVIIKSVRQTTFRKFKEQINHYRQRLFYIDFVTDKNERSIRTDFREKNRESTVSVNEKFLRFEFSDVHTAKITAIFTTTMTSKIQNTINEIIRQYALTNSFVSKSHKFSEFFELITENSRWNAFEIEFFDSMYNKKSINIDQTMKHTDRNTYLRNVHLFIEKTKNIAIIQKKQHVRDNLFTCFRKAALQ